MFYSMYAKLLMKLGAIDSWIFSLQFQKFQLTAFVRMLQFCEWRNYNDLGWWYKACEQVVSFVQSHLKLKMWLQKLTAPLIEVKTK